MNTRSKHRNRWVVAGIAAVLMLALVAASAPAATLSGTITDYSGYSHGRYYIYLVRLSLDQPIAGFAIVERATNWQIRNVADGQYFVLAYRDVNGNFVPSRGEPLGYYGVPFPSRVAVNGHNIGGLSVVLEANNLGAELRGQVTYGGALSGRIWVVPHTTPNLEITSVRGTPWTMTSPGEYETFVVDHGVYYITAWMDVNGNMLLDADEPVGKAGPINVIMTPGVTYTVNIQLIDQIARSTAVEPKTWSVVKGLYRN